MGKYAVDTETKTTVTEPSEEYGRTANLRGLDLSLTSYALANSAIHAKSNETREAYARLFFKVKHSVISRKLKFGLPADTVKVLVEIGDRAAREEIISNRLFLVLDLWLLRANALGYMPIGRLLHAESRAFRHDILGILDHLDRKTGRLVDFAPVSFAIHIVDDEPL